ncbi:MAG: TIR domain-containing protein [Cyanobacteriota bacterium]|jgi:hypothetical protein
MDRCSRACGEVISAAAVQAQVLLPHNGSSDCNPAGVTPRVFLSYSHDSEAHRAWVLLQVGRLRQGGVEVTLDQWDLLYGADVVRFMDLGIRDADRVLMVCTANYVAKAEERKGGAGYEGMIVTGYVPRATDTIKFVPIVRGNSGEPLAPRYPKPPLGRNPFAGSAPAASREGNPAPASAPPPPPPPPVPPSAVGAAPGSTPATATSPSPLALSPRMETSARLRREGVRWHVESAVVVGVRACDVDLGQGESLQLIRIQAGEFGMGSPATEPERSGNEGPQHRVRLAGFLLGQTPVTQAQWAAVAR